MVHGTIYNQRRLTTAARTIPSLEGKKKKGRQDSRNGKRPRPPEFEKKTANKRTTKLNEEKIISLLANRKEKGKGIYKVKIPEKPIRGPTCEKT